MRSTALAPPALAVGLRAALRSSGTWLSIGAANSMPAVPSNHHRNPHVRHASAAMILLLNGQTIWDQQSQAVTFRNISRRHRTSASRLAGDTRASRRPTVIANARALDANAGQLRDALESVGVTVQEANGALLVEGPCALLTSPARREIYAAREALFRLVAPAGSALARDGFPLRPQLERRPNFGRAVFVCFRNLQILGARRGGHEPRQAACVRNA